MQSKGSLPYEVVTQGSLVEHRIAKLGDVFSGASSSFHPERVEFCVGDAENLQLGTFDFILAANLICRVPHPRKLVDVLTRSLNQGGVLVLLTPFSWTEESTNKAEWLGGSESGGGRSEKVLKEVFEEKGFELLDEGSEPFLIPDHSRRFQLGFPMRSIWRKK